MRYLALILLLPEYFTELGFFFLVLVAAIGGMRRGTLDEAERTALALVGAGLLVSSFLRSTVIANNDLAFASILIVQFFLLLFGGALVRGAASARRDAAMRRLSVGDGLPRIGGHGGTRWRCCGCICRWRSRWGGLWPMDLAKRRWRCGGRLRRWMCASRKTRVVQFNTVQPGDYFHDAQILPVGRQVAAAFPDCPAAFGGEASRCDGVEAGVQAFFAPADNDVPGIAGGRAKESGGGRRGQCAVSWGSTI